MVTRYTIHKGDKTTAGGTVVGGSPMLGNHDQPIAHEGDDVSCPACNSTGKILCDGPRWPMTGPAGKQVALSDDLCLCHCKPLPKLVASQQTMSITVDGSSGDEAVQQATAQVYGAPAAAGSAKAASAAAAAQGVQTAQGAQAASGASGAAAAQVTQAAQAIQAASAAQTAPAAQIEQAARQALDAEQQGIGAAMFKRAG